MNLTVLQINEVTELKGMEEKDDLRAFKDTVLTGQ